MSADIIARLLRPGVEVRPELFNMMGSLAGAIFLAEAAWATQWSSEAYPDRGGWFYRTQDEWREKALLGEDALRSARGRAKFLGLLEEKRKGIPPRLWYRLDLDRLESLLVQQISQRRGTPQKKAGGAKTGDPANKDVDARQQRRGCLPSSTGNPADISQTTQTSTHTHDNENASLFSSAAAPEGQAADAAKSTETPAKAKDDADLLPTLPARVRNQLDARTAKQVCQILAHADPFQREAFIASAKRARPESWAAYVICLAKKAAGGELSLPVRQVEDSREAQIEARAQDLIRAAADGCQILVDGELAALDSDGWLERGGRMEPVRRLLAEGVDIHMRGSSRLAENLKEA